MEANGYVLDTNAVVFYFGDALSRLGAAAQDVFARFEARETSLYVPAPVLMEMAALERAGRWRLRGSFASWWARAEIAGYVGVPLEPGDVVAARDLEWSHRDPFDRVIVATALRLGLPLVTADAAITDWGRIEVVW